MEIVKKILNNYLSFSLSTIIALAAITGVSSCRSCENPTDTSGSIEISLNKYSLSEPERKFQVIFKLTDPEKVAMLGNYSMKVMVTQQGGKAGKSEISYTAYDDQGVIGGPESIKDGSEPITKDLYHFLKVGEKGVLEPKQQDLIAEFEFKPETDVKEMTAIFQLLDKANGDTPLGNPHTVIWNREVTAKYTIQLEGLEDDGTIKNTNNFILKVNKADGSKLEAGDLAEELRKIKVNVSTVGDATIDGLRADHTLSFAAGELTPKGALEKKVVVNPGASETTFTFQLQYEGKNIGTSKTAKCKPVAAGTYILAVDKTKIEDGSTDIVVTVSRAGEVDLEAVGLEELSLKIKRKNGTHATLAEISDGKLPFTAPNQLTVAGDNKTATKTLTIVPGEDKEATFKLTILDKEQKAIAGSKKIIEWGDGVKIEMIKLGYNITSGKIEYEIQNKGAAPTVNIGLSWESKKGTAVKIAGSNKGNTGSLILDGSNAKTAKGELEVGWDTDTHAKFEFKVEHGTMEEYKHELAFAQTAPKITIALEDSKVTKFVGDIKKQVTFAVTAGIDELSKEDLEATKLDYNAAHGKLLHKGKDVKDRTISLHTLLGIDTLPAGEQKQITLTIDNDKKSAVTFTDIKIKGSDNEDDDANKVKKIEWEGEIKIRVEGYDYHTHKASNLIQIEGYNHRNRKAVELDKLKGSLGKTVLIKFISQCEFNLEEADLRKVIINLSPLPLGASVEIDGNIIQDGTATLWDLLGEELRADATHLYGKDIILKPGQNESVNFTLTLGGENKAADVDKKVAVDWKVAGNIKVQVEGYDGTQPVDLRKLEGDASKMFPIRFVNTGEFTLGKEELEKVKVVLTGLTKGASVSYGDGTGWTEIKSGTTTLWELLLGRSLEASTPRFSNLLINENKNNSVKFTLTLAGENKETINKQVEVEWKKRPQVSIVDASSSIMLQGANKTFTLTFKNDGIDELDAVALSTMTVEIIDRGKVLSGIIYKNVQGQDQVVNSKNTTLSQLLKGETIKAGGTKDVMFTIDTGTAKAVSLIVGIHGSEGGAIMRRIEWRGEVRLQIDATEINVKGKDFFEFKVKNVSGFVLGKKVLKKITIRVDNEKLDSTDEYKALVIVYKNTQDDKMYFVNTTTLYGLLSTSKDLQINQPGTLAVDEEAIMKLRVWQGKNNKQIENKFSIQLVNAGTNERKNITWKSKR